MSQNSHKLWIWLAIALLLLLWSNVAYGQDEGGDSSGQDDTYASEEAVPEYIWSVTWSPDGEKIAIGMGGETCSNPNNDYSTHIINAQTGELIHILGNPLISECPVASLDWHPNSIKLVTGSQGQGAVIWNVDTADILAIKDMSTFSAFNEHLWSPDGTRLASIQDTDTLIHMWDILNPQGMLNFDGHYPGSITWNPQGTRLASTSEGIKIWNPDTGELLDALNTDVADKLTWSPDGTKFAGTDTHNTVVIWDASTGEKLKTLDGHTDYVTSVVWRFDSKTVASSSFDGTVRVWDIESGEQIASFTNPGSVYALDWSPDGTQLVYGGEGTEGEFQMVTVQDIPQPTPSAIPGDNP